MSASGTCIVCGTLTAARTDGYGDVTVPNPHRSEGYKGRKHWRCSDGEACASRRTARRRRPR